MCPIPQHFAKGLQMYALFTDKTSTCPKIYAMPFYKLLIISKYFATILSTCEKSADYERFTFL